MAGVQDVLAVVPGLSLHPDPVKFQRSVGEAAEITAVDRVAEERRGLLDVKVLLELLVPAGRAQDTVPDLFGPAHWRSHDVVDIL